MSWYTTDCVYVPCKIDTKQEFNTFTAIESNKHAGLVMTAIEVAVSALEKGNLFYTVELHPQNVFE